MYFYFKLFLISLLVISNSYFLILSSFMFAKYFLNKNYSILLLNSNDKNFKFKLISRTIFLFLFLLTIEVLGIISYFDFTLLGLLGSLLVLLNILLLRFTFICDKGILSYCFFIKKDDIKSLDFIYKQSSTSRILLIETKNGKSREFSTCDQNLVIYKNLNLYGYSNLFACEAYNFNFVSNLTK